VAQGAEFPETNTGPLYVTLSGAFNPDSSVTVVSQHTLSMEESQGARAPPPPSPPLPPYSPGEIPCATRGRGSMPSELTAH
jgi:hypothetical protein